MVIEYRLCARSVLGSPQLRALVESVLRGADTGSGRTELFGRCQVLGQNEVLVQRGVAGALGGARGQPQQGGHERAPEEVMGGWQVQGPHGGHGAPAAQTAAQGDWGVERAELRLLFLLQSP